jgi:hypothetical protein
LLIAAVHHFPVFERLEKEPLSIEELRHLLGLKERPAMVLFPALCAMELLAFNSEHKLFITPLGKFLLASASPNLIGYVGLEKNDAGVLEMVDQLKNDGPPDPSTGLSYVKEGDTASPMDDPQSARFFTLALAGRAQYLSPLVAARLPSKTHLLDVAGGTGYYSYEWLLANPAARATVVDRPAVLEVAKELLEAFSLSGRPGAAGVKARVTFLPGDMLSDALPKTDLLLAASLFHDWPQPTCQLLAKRFANALHPGGELWVHDAFLQDTLDGPLAVTDYSAMLFLHTKGRAYSRKEYAAWLKAAGLDVKEQYTPTLMEYGLLSAHKSA